MKVVVAGATGAIGRPLVTALRRGGHQVYALTRGGRGAEIARGLGATPLVANVMDRSDLLRATERLTADAVIHQLTAHRHSPPTHYHAPGLLRTNALREIGSKHLVELAQRTGARRYLTQSLIVGYGLRDHGSGLVTEQDPFGRIPGDVNDGVIGALHQAESSAWRAPGIGGIALRYGLFYGPGASDTFVRALSLRMLALPSTVTGYAGFVHIEDAAAATVAALERGVAGRAYNIVDDEPVTWGTMLDAMAAAVGARPPRRVPARLLRMTSPLAAAQMLDLSIRVSNAQARTELGWRPRYPSYREGLPTLAHATE
ncbi:NAD-dependent epimerase/dehydratase family protein [Nocardia seriolae]|uniref:NAD-dependent epimerase/dehydratase domain-containing protein n=1 Tax=Nocardia seriolae TaxID=37332 RepID=A0A0B8NKQ8_9NOCA|nr:NAD(P)-dependent oxidoreductase [Nocardia seriolae]MTJ62419.1 NAD-dependent epimerase/dehydratase family protein [Nocardia seriolae]MTJ75995.1 NAD-dependent epimerase/dehydratase family protein [Nocardia seriolae]MTJ87322.1 NAD-dependent epimerase/dehydratase family protein [Nocardia seriolae]MTK31316.1 NAD-dependent epimerase/dehydratase family protein [Nocardia seriolae]MTK40367.1 NAD-dependent epimerase/dehydratase family protein [Nocardia seriolae]